MNTSDPLHLDHILVARDLAGNSDRALRYALSLAQACGATVHVVHGTFATGHPDDVPPEAEVSDDVLLAQLRAGLGASSTGTDASETGLTLQLAVARGTAPAAAVLRYAEEHHVDLIVAGTHGRRGLARLLKGSVSEHLVRSAPCPVSVVPPTARA